MWVRGILLIALSACTVDSTGLLEFDSGIGPDVRPDISQPDAGPTPDVNLADVSLDVNVPDVPADVMDDVPLDVPPDVPMPDAGPDVPMPPTACADPTLAVCYLFEDNVDDGSMNARHLTAANISFADGAEGRAASFDENSELSLRDRPLGLGLEFTVEFWFQLKDAIPMTMLRWAVLDDNAGVAVFAFPRSAGETLIQATLSNRRVSIRVPTEGWHHLVGVSRAGSLELFLDDNSGIDNRASRSVPEENLHIGSNSTPNPDVFEERFQGLIDHIRIWDRALSAEEVRAILMP